MITTAENDRSFAREICATSMNEARPATSIPPLGPAPPPPGPRLTTQPAPLPVRRYVPDPPKYWPMYLEEEVCGPPDEYPALDRLHALYKKRAAKEPIEHVEKVEQKVESTEQLDPMQYHYKRARELRTQLFPPEIEGGRRRHHGGGGSQPCTFWDDAQRGMICVKRVNEWMIRSKVLSVSIDFDFSLSVDSCDGLRHRMLVSSHVCTRQRPWLCG